MNLAKAVHLLAAAKEDPVLAAWTFMILELEVSPAPDTLSPEDAWDAYQKFYDLGLVSTAHFRRIDPERTFFAHSAKPSWGSIQSVLSTYASIGKEPPPMTKHRIQNPFAQPDDTALASREPTSATVPPVRSVGLPRAPFGNIVPGLQQSNPFSKLGLGEARQLDQQLRSGGTPFSTRERSDDGGLPCRETQAAVVIGGRTFEPEIYCCSKKLEMMSDGGQVVGPDDLPGNSVSVIDAIFHAHCPHCQRVWHVSVGETISQDSVR